jgi:hypothetical protein
MTRFYTFLVTIKDSHKTLITEAQGTSLPHSGVGVSHRPKEVGALVTLLIGTELFMQYHQITNRRFR